ncbi:MAG: galactose-1-phosphate uridylyltransferase [Fimbriimonadia bacterium]
MSELRWHPFLREWVITATHRQDRTFFPPDDYCPLCPTKPGGFPTEIEREDYDIVVFENKFPSLQRTPPEPSVEGNDLCPVRPAVGVCEVVCYTSDHNATFADLDLRRVTRLVDVWADRTEELGARPEVHYVFVFENKGKEIGVTLSHPHGQIYAYPCIPPKIRTELDASREHFDRTGRRLMSDVVRMEEEDGRRLVARTGIWQAFIPFFARYPYETYIAPVEHRGGLPELSRSDRRDLAAALLDMARRYDKLWGFSLPYMMVFHQQPTDGGDHGHYTMHVEFYPPYRTPDKLKFLAGSESGAGAFINDTMAEEKAAELRSADPGPVS